MYLFIFQVSQVLFRVDNVKSDEVVQISLAGTKFGMLLKYGFCKKYFDRNEPLTSWTLLSPIFFPDQHWSLSKYFLQNPYFRGRPKWWSADIRKSENLLNISWKSKYKKEQCFFRNDVTPLCSTHVSFMGLKGRESMA